MDMVIVVVLGSTLDSTKWGLCGPRDLVGRMWIRKPLLPTVVYVMKTTPGPSMA